jgi:hypothetical protein
MESTGIPNRVQISRQTYERVHDLFKFEERTGIEVKGKGQVTTYVVSSLSAQTPELPKQPKLPQKRSSVLEDVALATAFRRQSESFVMATEQRRKSAHELIIPNAQKIFTPDTPVSEISEDNDYQYQ